MVLLSFFTSTSIHTLYNQFLGDVLIPSGRQFSTPSQVRSDHAITFESKVEVNIQVSPSHVSVSIIPLIAEGNKCYQYKVTLLYINSATGIEPMCELSLFSQNIINEIQVNSSRKHVSFIR